jgi:hypothetical protein
MNRSAGIGAGLLAGLLVLAGAPAAAMAAPLHHGAVAKHHPNRHGGHRFSLTGLVTAANGANLQVLVGHGQLAGRQLAKQSVPVVLGAHRGRRGAPAVGDTINAQGTADPSTGQLDASNFEVRQPRSGAIAGVIDAIDGTMISVNVTAVAGAAEAASSSEVLVDAAQAVVSMDGQPASVSQLTVGGTVAILGETDDQSAVATQVLAFSTAPSIDEGTVTQTNGSLIALSSENGDFTVDATSSQIILDGQAGGTVDQIASGDEVLAVGTAGSDPLAASTIFAFSQGEDGSGD